LGGSRCLFTYACIFPTVVLQLHSTPKCTPPPLNTNATNPNRAHHHHPTAKLEELGKILNLNGPGGRPRLLQVVARAPNLLTRSAPALRHSWKALNAALGSAAAAALLLGPGGSPQLLAYSSKSILARCGALDRLALVSKDWETRVAAVRADPQQLAAVLAAKEAESSRVQWLVETDQKLAPGGVGLVDLVKYKAEAFADIYPHWRVVQAEKMG